MRRVVVTGVGTVNPCGNSAPASWAALLAGVSGVGPITRFDASGLPVQIAAEVKGFDGEALLGKKQVRRLDLFTQYAVVAAREALQMSRYTPTEGGDPRLGVFVGSGIGGISDIYDTSTRLDRDGIGAVSAYFLTRSLANMATGQIAQELGAQGPSLCLSTACATGNHAIGEAWRSVRYGEADVVIAGGAEAAVGRLAVAGFSVMRALSRRNDAPEAASRPFDADRDGFVLGEGAGVLVLESLDHARARGAPILAELIGYAHTNDAYHDTQPSPGGAGAARCMALALARAGVKPDAVGYINAHGTSTPQNDISETQAIKAVFGAHAHRLAVSSTKSMTGHLLGAAGGAEAVFTVLSLSTGWLPPTINLDTPDPACDLDYVPEGARLAHPRVALSNAFGFGGFNATLIFQGFDSTARMTDQRA